MKFLITNLFLLFAVVAFSQDPFSGQTYSVEITASDANGNKQVLKQVTTVNSYDDLKRMFIGSSIVKDFATDIMKDVRSNYKEGQAYAFSSSKEGKSVEVTINEGNTSKSLTMKKPGQRRIIINQNGDSDVFELDEDIVVEVEDGQTRTFRRGAPIMGNRNMSPRIAGLDDRNVAFMGVTVGPFDYKNDSKNDIRGVKVLSVVTGEAAFNAGIEERDVITNVGETKTPSPSLFTKAIKDLEPGEEVTITFYRDGKKMTQSTIIGVREGNSFIFEGDNLSFDFDALPHFENNGQFNNLFGESRPLLGVSIEELEDGVTVQKVTEASTAEEMGLKEGDVITEFNGDKISTSEQLIELVQEHEIDDEVTVKYKRNGKTKKATGKLKEDTSANIFFMPEGGGQWNQMMPENFEFNFDGNMQYLEDLLSPERMKELENRIKELEQKLEQNLKKKELVPSEYS